MFAKNAGSNYRLRRTALRMANISKEYLALVALLYAAIKIRN
jgi:hypothetical protein